MSNGIQHTLLLSVTTTKEFRRVIKSNRWAGSREISHDPVGSNGSLRRSVILKSCRGDSLNGFPFCKNSSPIMKPYKPASYYGYTYRENTAYELILW